MFDPPGYVELAIFSKSMALLLSYISQLCAILYPCASMEYIDHSIWDIAPSTPISLPSVELFPFIFCFVDNVDTDPLSRDIIAPVCTQ